MAARRALRPSRANSARRGATRGLRGSGRGLGGPKEVRTQGAHVRFIREGRTSALAARVRGRFAPWLSQRGWRRAVRGGRARFFGGPRCWGGAGARATRSTGVGIRRGVGRGARRRLRGVFAERVFVGDRDQRGGRIVDAAPPATEGACGGSSRANCFRRACANGSNERRYCRSASRRESLACTQPSAAVRSRPK